MNVVSIFIIFLILVLAVVFIVGGIILIVGLSKKNKRNSSTKAGLFIMIIPIGIIIIMFLYDFLHDRFTKKPTDKDLVGVYQITDASGLIPRHQYLSYRLEFKNDQTFYLSQIPNVSICETGKYSVDWQLNFNELSFICDKELTSAHIDRSFSGFKIEFIIGDPDNGESIYFSKDK